MLDTLENQKLGEIIGSCPIGMMLIDSSQTVSWVNNSVKKLLGARVDQLIDQQYSDLDDALKPLLDTESTVHLPATEQDEERWILVTSKEVNGSGHIKYLVDVSPLRVLMEERTNLQEEIRELQAIDEQTGLPNSRALFQSLEPQVSRSRRYNNPLSIVIMRITNLEQLQQQYGDDIKALMVSISQMLNEQMRWADIIGRLSDEDFLLVLPETHQDGALAIADKLRTNMSMLYSPDVDIDASAIKVDFGIAEWGKGDDVGLLMMRARDILNNK